MPNVRTLTIYVAAALFAVALGHWFYALGRPYFEIPRTVQDHVAVKPYVSRDAILLSRRAAALLPRGATVTVVQPSRKDDTLYLTAAGVMPHQVVIYPELKNRPDYVLALREPLNDRAYRLIFDFPEGRIYARWR
jgi:hypothetical protein